jgi:hypothetical protein
LSGKNQKKTKKFRKPKSCRQLPLHLIHISFSSFIHKKSKKSTLKPLIFAGYWGSPLVQFSKFNNFLRACWFLCKNLSNSVYPVWKLHNRYCHNNQASTFRQQAYGKSQYSLLISGQSAVYLDLQPEIKILNWLYHKCFISSPAQLIIITKMK